MNPEAAAERVCKVVHQYAYRKRNTIAHTGHTERRLLDAVAALIGKRVNAAPKTTSTMPHAG